MAKIDELIKHADKTAASHGGLISLLLATKSKQQVEWDKNEARFIVDGKKIPIEDIQKELSRIESKVAAQVALYNNKLWTKEWGLETWRKAMEKLVQDNHILFAALAFGGIALVAGDPTVERRTERDLDALRRFSIDIKRGLVNSSAVAYNRGRTYLRSWYVTYHLLSHKAHILAGFESARRVLTKAEHCRTKTVKGATLEGCLEVAKKGWMPIREMPVIGVLVCKQFCKCWIKYSRRALRGFQV